jgi:tetratricopeptide (TPR) repeat protein
VERNLKQILSEQTSIFAYCSAESLWRVAEEALKVGWKDWAKELVQEAIKFAQKVADKYEKAKVLLDAVKVMVKAGQLDEAKALLSEEGEEWMRYKILSGIAEGLAGMRRYDEAIEIVDGVETPYPKGEILANVAEAAARLGDIERARQIFERAKQSVSRAEVLAFISEQQAEVGLVEEAVETIERYLVLEAVEHSKNRCEALAMVAEVLIEAGQIEDAETIANAVKDEEWRAWVLGRLAVEFETLGQRRKAEEALRRAVKAAIMSQERDAVVNELLFRSALDLGWSEAIDIALSEVTTSVKAKFLRAGFLDEVKKLFVEFMADSGMTEKAFELAQSIADPELQAWALVAVAKAIGKAGDKKRAEELLDWAWQIGEQSHYSCYLQCKVIKIFAQLGDWEKAMARLEKIRGCTYDLVEEAVKQDRLDLARKVLGKRKEDEYEVWTKFIETLAETGNEEVAKTEFEAAKKWAIRLKDRETRNEALKELVEMSARLSWMEETEALLEAIDDEEARKSALELAIQNCKKPEVAEYFAQRLNDPDAWCLVGEMCVETGQKEKALSAFRKALQLADRQSVTEVATMMIEAGFFDEGVKLLEGRRLDAFTLHHVLDVLAQRAERKNFLKLLPQCRWSGNLAYRACGWLAKLYPERAKDLAHEILNA